MLQSGFVVVVVVVVAKMICSGSGKLGLKMGVSKMAHTQYAHIWKYPPPPPEKKNSF